MQAILAMEGLSMAEKQAMIEEQERIMASIEKEKKSSQATAADRFVQRSHAAAVQAIGGSSRVAAPPPASATSSSGASRTVDIGNGTQVALRGQEQTQKAIKDGTAVLAQCMSCENWMQVTGNATLMFCPVCQTVSPVLREDDEASAQLKADMELAQKLQNEEYSASERRDERRAASAAKKNATAKSGGAASSSWMDWLGFGSTAATGVAAPPPSFAVKPPGRGEVGVSRPPGSGRPALSPARTGEESSIGHVPSYDEDVPMLGSGGPAVVAQKQSSIFACVGDSISSAANSLTTALTTDSEGNVHGVDGSGLLAVTQVGRDTQYQQMGNGGAM